MPPETLSSKQLAEECWAHNPQARPSFRDVVTRLEALHNDANVAAHEAGAPAAAAAGGGGGGAGAGLGLGVSPTLCFEDPNCAGRAVGSAAAIAARAAAVGAGGGVAPSTPRPIRSLCHSSRRQQPFLPSHQKQEQQQVEQHQGSFSMGPAAGACTVVAHGAAGADTIADGQAAGGHKQAAAPAAAAAAAAGRGGNSQHESVTGWF